MTLPLRLAAEPILRNVIGPCFVLPSSNEEMLCIVVSDDGIIAIVRNESNEINEDIYSDILGISIPSSIYILCRTRDEFVWYKDGRVCINQPPTRESILSSAIDVSIDIARIIVEAVQRYYSRQVLEPSIRGFLAILEKQFPRNDLYLFELLQNAVDDGANKVVVKSSHGSHSHIPEGILFCHNGRRFTPLDVLGLASVGLSTKGSSGEKRKIGFMGVGFKAVYKRYARVVVCDNTWSFCFDEPATSPTMEPTHSWVLKPQWVHSSELNSLKQEVSKAMSHDSAARGWCSFFLQRPRGGMHAVKSDLAGLSTTVPVLLGRQAFNSTNAKEWTLHYQDDFYRVCDHVVSPISETFTACKTPVCSEWKSSYADTVRLEHEKQSHVVQFLNVCFVPNLAARNAFELHTKKKWSIKGNSSQVEEVSLFFSICSKTGLPDSMKPGLLYALLPTKLALPTPGIHMQGSWLLSVDRQDVQSLTDNEWNMCLLSQYPRLVVLYLHWVSTAKQLSTNIGSAYRQIPEFSWCSSSEKLVVEVLGQRLDATEVRNAVLHTRIVPAWRSSTEVGFFKSAEVIWLPPEMMKYLPRDIVCRWFGLHPFASDLLCECAWYELWHCIPRVTARLLRDRISYFQLSNDEDHVKRALSFLSALEAAASVSSEKIKATAPTSQSAPSEGGTEWLPALNHWPVFYTSDGSFVTLDKLAWPKPEDFQGIQSLPIYDLLRKGVLLAAEHVELERRKQTENMKQPSFKKKRKHRNNESTNVSLKLMHKDVEEALVSPSDSAQHNEVADKIRLSRLCISRAQALNPSRVIGVDAACSALLTYWADLYKGSRLPSDIVNDVVTIFQWALTAERPGAVSHLLVEDSRCLKLVPSGSAYISTDNFTSANRTRDSSLSYVASVYVKKGFENNTRWMKLYHTFLSKCGAQNGVSLEAHLRRLTADEESLIPQIRLRQSNASFDMFLPFNLGKLTKKKVEIVDVDIAQEWIEIIQSTHGSEMSNATRVAVMICLLLENADYASSVTADSTPYLSSLLCGKPGEKRREQLADDNNWVATTNVNSSHRIPPDMDRYPPPAYARMYYLPPGQPGASVMNVGLAAWIKRLADYKWVPATMPGALCDDPATVLLRPCEVVLSPGSEYKPNISIGTSVTETMPVLKLPPRASRTLKNLDSVVSALFAWGTVKPPPPIEQLHTLAQSISARDVEEPAVCMFTGGVIRCSRAKYVELIAVWRSICLAQRENRLSSSDKKRIRTACCGTAQSHCSSDPVFVIPGHMENTLYTLSRCVDIGIRKSSSTSSDEIKVNMVKLLAQAGYLHNLRSDVCWVSNNGGTNQDPVAWPLGAFKTELCELLTPPVGANPYHATDFLKQFCQRVYEEKSVSTPCAFEKKAFSYCLWTVVESALNGAKPHELLKPGQISTARNYILKNVPNLCVYCLKGPGFSLTAFPARWIMLWKENDVSEKVHPVLLDDANRVPTGCGVLRSSLLNPEHSLQPIGMLDHSCRRRPLTPSPIAEKEELKTLSEIDSQLLEILQIPRISDNKYFSLTSSIHGKQVTIAGGQQRLRIVYLLLILCTQSEERCTELPPTPPMYKHESISLVFKTPENIDGDLVGRAKSTSIPAYAIWGKLVKVDNVDDTKDSKCNNMQRAIIICGTPSDYTSDLEDLILSRFLDGMVPRTNPHCRKALSLLSHVENEDEFLKFLYRHFSSYISDAKGTMVENHLESCEDTVDTSTLKILSELHDEVKSLSRMRDERASSTAFSTTDKKRKRSGLVDKTPSSHEEKIDIYCPPVGGVSAETNQMEASRITEEMKIRQTNIAAADLFLSEENFPCATAYTGRGRGRGVSNLPAWLSSDQSALNATASETVQGEERGSVNELSNSSCMAPSGRGRGVLNIPSWMSNGEVEKSVRSSVESGDSGISSNDVSSVPSLSKLSDVTLQNIEPASKKSKYDVQAPTQTQLPGRGRGICNRPAWMSRDENSISDTIGIYGDADAESGATHSESNEFTTTNSLNDSKDECSNQDSRCSELNFVLVDILRLIREVGSNGSDSYLCDARVNEIYKIISHSICTLPADNLLTLEGRIKSSLGQELKDLLCYYHHKMEGTNEYSHIAKFLKVN